MLNEPLKPYQVALSFAGEDRAYVEQVAALLKEAGIRLFYDEYQKVNLWGKNLYAHFQDVYQNQADYTVMFISAHYAKKRWTKHERESAQARAFLESREYILPVRFDDTEIPGLTPTTGYLDLRNTTPYELVGMILEKLRTVVSVGGRNAGPQQAFIMHAAARGSINLPYTVTRRRRIRELVESLPEESEEREYFASSPALHNAFPDASFNCWGVPRGAMPSFQQTNIGDLVLFVGPLSEDAAVRQIGIVKAKSPIECPQASRILWPEAEAGRTYPLLFFFDTEVGLRPWDDFLADIGRPGFNPMGWYKRIGNEYFERYGGPAGYLPILRQLGGFVPLTERLR